MVDFIIKYWAEFFFGVFAAILTAIFSYYYNLIKKRFKEHDDLKEGIVALLHDRLFQSCMYFLDKGEISIAQFDNITEMYNSYHKLGGNGTGTEIYERVRELPIKK